jgi:hypothetical protein
VSFTATQVVAKERRGHGREAGLSQEEGRDISYVVVAHAMVRPQEPIPVLLQEPSGARLSPHLVGPHDRCADPCVTVQHSTSAGAIPLGKCTVKAVELETKDKDKDKDSQEFCFEIVTNYRTYCLMAATEKERQKWMEAIEAKIKSTETTVPLSPAVSHRSHTSSRRSSCL